MKSCILATYAIACAMHGIALSELRMETEGDIDLRGMFNLDPQVPPGYDQLNYRVHIRGNGTLEQFRKIHEIVNATSPNRFNVANAIRLNGELVVE